MKISLNWLKDYAEFDKKLTVKEIAWRLTEATAEIEKTHDLGKGLENVVVGELLKFEKHPNADTLSVAQIKISPKETIQVIFGQKAVVHIGDRMAVAIAPSDLPGGKIERKSLRGVMSEGMLCLDSELVKGAQESLTKFGKEVKVGTKVVDLLGLNDVVFEVDNHSITHRPDLFSHYGFARECVALGLAKWKKQLRDIDPQKLGGKKPLSIKPTFASKQCSKNYYSTVIKGLSTKPSPAWLKARLQAVGIRSINAIVDVTKYVMMEIGQPCHAFDFRLLEGKTFLHRLSKRGEKVKTLDGVERTLDDGVIVVQSGDAIVDLCGIMGAENSEIREDTSTIYLHSCHYDNVLVRKAMTGLGHRTEAGTIFEKNLEPERAKIGLTRALQLLREVFPKADFSHKVFHQQYESSKKMAIRLPFAKISSHIGISILPKTAQKILEDLGFSVKKTKDAFSVVPPSWRANGVAIPEDVVEEVARINGYSKVPAMPPTVELVTPHRIHKRHAKRTVQQFLIGQGFQEEVNFSFLSEQHLKKINHEDRGTLIEIKNPVSEDFRFMRPNFLPYLLGNLARNQLMGQSSWKSFEMGAVYQRDDDEVSEEHRLTFVVASEQQSFYEAKGIAEAIGKELSLSTVSRPAESRFGYPGRCLSILAEEKIIGEVYELHPLFKEQFGIKGSVSVVELNLDQLYQLKPTEVVYQQLNRNPEALLDISVLVDKKTIMSEIENLIRAVETKYLKKTQLIDVYEGKNIGEDKKSLTFALAYQHPDRTLDEKEIQSILDSLIKKIEAAGGVVRR